MSPEASIAGAVIGSTALFALAVFIPWWCIRRRNRVTAAKSGTLVDLAAVPQKHRQKPSGSKTLTDSYDIERSDRLGNLPSPKSRSRSKHPSQPVIPRHRPPPSLSTSISGPSDPRPPGSRHPYIHPTSAIHHNGYSVDTFTATAAGTTRAGTERWTSGTPTGTDGEYTEPWLGSDGSRSLRAMSFAAPGSSVADSSVGFTSVEFRPSRPLRIANIQTPSYDHGSPPIRSKPMATPNSHSPEFKQRRISAPLPSDLPPKQHLIDQIGVQVQQLRRTSIPTQSTLANGHTSSVPRPLPSIPRSTIPASTRVLDGFPTWRISQPISYDAQPKIDELRHVYPLPRPMSDFAPPLLIRPALDVKNLEGANHQTAGPLIRTTYPEDYPPKAGSLTDNQDSPAKSIFTATSLLTASPTTTFASSTSPSAGFDIEITPADLGKRLNPRPLPSPKTLSLPTSSARSSYYSADGMASDILDKGRIGEARDSVYHDQQLLPRPLPFPNHAVHPIRDSDVQQPMLTMSSTSRYTAEEKGKGKATPPEVPLPKERSRRLPPTPSMDPPLVQLVPLPVAEVLGPSTHPGPAADNTSLSLDTLTTSLVNSYSKTKPDFTPLDTLSRTHSSGNGKLAAPLDLTDTLVLAPALEN